MKVLIADCETTGIDPQKDQIIEAAWDELPDLGTFMMGGGPGAQYSERFNPGVSIALGAMATHNIIKDNLVGMRPSEDFSFPGDVDYLIGHNIDFDWSFFEQDMPKQGWTQSPRLICTLALSRWLFPELETHRQVAMIYYIGMTTALGLPAAQTLVKDAHDAFADVQACRILLKFLIEEMGRRGKPVLSWKQLWEYSEIARVPTVVGFGKHKGTPIADVPRDYIMWYMRQTETDPMYVKAFKAVLGR